MKARFQIIDHKDGLVLDTELTARNRFTALHELLKVYGVQYDPAQFKERKGWVEFKDDHATYRTSTRYS
jgi:hypothetical protein